jgi:hypothetical protein
MAGGRWSAIAAAYWNTAFGFIKIVVSKMTQIFEHSREKDIGL